MVWIENFREFGVATIHDHKHGHERHYGAGRPPILTPVKVKAVICSCHSQGSDPDYLLPGNPFRDGMPGTKWSQELPRCWPILREW